MTNEELIGALKSEITALYSRFGEIPEHDRLGHAIAEAIRLLTVYDRPPTVEEVGDGEPCLWCVWSAQRRKTWKQETGSVVREWWSEGERWMYLPKVTP